jgi:hypothetical protein
MEGLLTLREVLLCEANDCVPEGIDPQMFKDADDSDPAPTYDELEDGMLQFYNGESGRPCRNLCEFEKDLLKEFWCQSMSMSPYEAPSFKDLEIWRQMLNTPGLDAWETFVKTHQTPRQKEEREDSIKEWRTLMHDRFWHKQHGCQCKSRRDPERFAVEETVGDVTVSLVKPRLKKGKVPVKKETIDETMAPVPESAQQEGQENGSVKTNSISIRKAPKKNTANETESKKRKSATEVVKVPNTVAELTEMITEDLDKPDSAAKLNKELKEMGYAAHLKDLKATGYELKSTQDTTSRKKRKISARKTPMRAIAAPSQDMHDTPVKKLDTSARKTPKKTVSTQTGADTVSTPEMMAEANTADAEIPEKVTNPYKKKLSLIDLAIQQHYHQELKDAPVEKPRTPAQKAPEKIAPAPKSSDTAETPSMSAAASEKTVTDGTPNKKFQLKLKLEVASVTIDERGEEEMNALVKKPRTRAPARNTPKKNVATSKNADPAGTTNISTMDDTPSKQLNLASMKIEEDVEEMMAAPVKIPKTPRKRKTPVKKNAATPKQAETAETPEMSAKTPIGTVTEDTPSKQLNITSMTISEQEDEEMMDAPAKPPYTPAKPKASAQKNAGTVTPSKKRKTPAKMQPTTPETPTKKGKAAEKEVVGVEKSGNIILF